MRRHRLIVFHELAVDFDVRGDPGPLCTDRVLLSIYDRDGLDFWQRLAVLFCGGWANIGPIDRCVREVFV